MRPNEQDAYIERTEAYPPTPACEPDDEETDDVCRKIRWAGGWAILKVKETCDEIDERIKNEMP